MMIDESLARLRAHRSNIQRYRRLLGTQLTELETEFIERRLSEERQAAKRLSEHTFPFSLRLASQTPAENDPLLSAEAWSWSEGELHPPSAQGEPDVRLAFPTATQKGACVSEKI
jgi:hypothetical protein